MNDYGEKREEVERETADFKLQQQETMDQQVQRQEAEEQLCQENFQISKGMTAALRDRIKTLLSEIKRDCHGIMPKSPTEWEHGYIECLLSYLDDWVSLRINFSESGLECFVTAGVRGGNVYDKTNFFPVEQLNEDEVFKWFEPLAWEAWKEFRKRSDYSPDAGITTYRPRDN